MQIVSFEGLPGCGKSTLLSELVKTKKFHDMFGDYKVLPEPVDNIKILQEHYKTGKYAFQLQLEFFIERAKIWEEINNHCGTWYFTERTPESELVFSKTYQKAGMISQQEYNDLTELYRLQYDSSCNDPMAYAHAVFYFSSSVDFCIDNIKKRNRLDESKSFFTDRKFMNTLKSEYDDYISDREQSCYLKTWDIGCDNITDRIDTVLKYLEQYKYYVNDRRGD